MKIGNYLILIGWTDIASYAQTYEDTEIGLVFTCLCVRALLTSILNALCPVKIQLTKRSVRPKGGRGAEKGIGPKKRPYLNYARTLWSADNRRRVELENPSFSTTEVEQKLTQEFDALDVKEQLKEVRRAKQVVGPDIKDVEMERLKRERMETKKLKSQRSKSRHDAKLCGRIKRCVLALFGEGLYEKLD